MILTERLWLGPLEEADAPHVFPIWGDPGVMVFCGGAAGEERVLQAVKNCRACQEEHGYSPFAVLTRADHALIGICGLKSLQDPEGAELIYHFLPAVWGRGYATEAVLGLLSWAARCLPLRYLEASFDERNAASRNVLVKAGFTCLEDRWYEDVQRTEPVYRFALQSPE